MDYKLILNLSNHRATPTQIAYGVEEHQPGGVRDFLMFEHAPTGAELKQRVSAIVTIATTIILARTGWTQDFWDSVIAEGVDAMPAAMVGGAPFVVAELERALVAAGIQPIYPFVRGDGRGQYVQDGWVVPEL